MAKVVLVIPVYNEERRLPRCIGRLLSFLSERGQFECRVIIADNGSTDRTTEIGRSMEEHFADVRAVHLVMKGRGRAVKEIWMGNEADVLSYMDVDLSTDLESYPRMIEALAHDKCDLAIGSRLSRTSRTTRSLQRELASRCYNWLLRSAFQIHFRDAQCGFKGITRRAAQSLLPLVEDNDWFFDTELLVLAEKLGYRILEIPVRWVEDHDSRVKMLRTAIDDLKGMMRLHHKLKIGEYVGRQREKSSDLTIGDIRT